MGAGKPRLGINGALGHGHQRSGALSDDHIDDLSAKLLLGDPIDEEEREFLSELVKRFGHTKRPSREVARLRSKAIAMEVCRKFALWKFVDSLGLFGHFGKPKLEALVAEAERASGFKRRHIYNILEKHKHRDLLRTLEWQLKNCSRGSKVHNS